MSYTIQPQQKFERIFELSEIGSYIVQNLKGKFIQEGNTNPYEVNKPFHIYELFGDRIEIICDYPFDEPHNFSIVCRHDWYPIYLMSDKVSKTKMSKCIKKTYELAIFFIYQQYFSNYELIPFDPKYTLKDRRKKSIVKT